MQEQQEASPPASPASWWLLGGGGKETRHDPSSSAGPTAAASPDFAFRDADNARFSPGQAAKMRSARPRRWWQSREERWRRVDREFDLVIVAIELVDGYSSEGKRYIERWLSSLQSS